MHVCVCKAGSTPIKICVLRTVCIEFGLRGSDLSPVVLKFGYKV